MSADVWNVETLGSLGERATITLPAELRFLELVQVSVGVALKESGCDAGCARDLQLATDELAAILITSARTPSALHVSVTHDETDAYVRMSVPIADVGFNPEHAGLTRLLLDATADSYEVRTDGNDLVGVLQRALDSGRPTHAIEGAPDGAPDGAHES